MTVAEYERLYAEGRAAWRKEVGTHGPTLRRPAHKPPACPYREGSAKAVVWWRGYYQDVRR